MYVYKETERNSNGILYTVGFYSPDGKWNPESDHDSKESAGERVHYLNGGFDTLLGLTLQTLAKLEHHTHQCLESQCQSSEPIYKVEA